MISWHSTLQASWPISCSTSNCSGYQQFRWGSFVGWLFSGWSEGERGRDNHLIVSSPLYPLLLLHSLLPPLPSPPLSPHLYFDAQFTSTALPVPLLSPSIFSPSLPPCSPSLVSHIETIHGCAPRRGQPSSAQRCCLYITCNSSNNFHNLPVLHFRGDLNTLYCRVF